MAIGIAMLGFGASGTLLALMPRLTPPSADRWFVWGTLTAALSLIASPILLNRVSLDPTQIIADPTQWLRLALVYIILAVPFGAGALAVLVGLTLDPKRIGTLYGASFVGSGLGSVVALVVLWVFLPARALAVPAVLGAAAAIVASWRSGGHRIAATVAWASVGLSLLVVARPLWRLEVTPFKALPQVEAYPGAKRVLERGHPVGWVVAVEAPAFRYAPGLSLEYRGPVPSQTALFVDGHAAGGAADWGRDSAATTLLDWLPSAIPYALGQRGRVLVIGVAGGTEVWNGLVHGARHITAVELHPALASFARHSIEALLGEESGDGTPTGVPSRWDADIEWLVGDARTHVARTRRRFDLVTLGPGGGFGATTAGMHSLNEDFLHTVDAYVAYLDRLAPGGVVAITRWVSVPPRESLRVILTAGRALRRVAPAPDALNTGLVVVRSWATATVLVKPDGFAASEIDGLKAWTTTRGFDLDWYPGLVEPATQFHFLDEPVLFDAAVAATAGAGQDARFASSYPFDVEPVSDARPYPHSFLRTRSLGPFLRAGRGSWLPFAEWGHVALVATLLQSALLAGLAIIVPVALRAGAPSGTRLRPIIGYFALIGFAYLAAEVAAIQQLSLLLGHPVYAVAAVLAAFLVCSGVGSAWSDRIPPARCWTTILGLAGLLAVYAAILLALVHALQPAPMGVRVVAGVLAIGPAAVLMGIPFPVGVRRLADGDAKRTAWAWAANGFASVVAAPLAALMAVELGSRMVLLAAAIAYAVAAAIHRGLTPAAAPQAIA